MVIYEENTKRIVIPSGLGNLTGLMEAEAQAMYNSGRTDGYNEGVEVGKSIQDSKLTESVTFNENGEYDADYGYKKVIVDVDKNKGHDIILTSHFDAADDNATLIYMEYIYLNGNPDGIYIYDNSRITKENNSVSFWISGFSADVSTVYSMDILMDFHLNTEPLMNGSRMNLVLNGIPLTITGWSKELTWQAPDDDDRHHTQREYRYHWEFRPVELTDYEVGFHDGYASGYTDGQASCPECSGTTDCSEAVADAFQSGYTNGYASGYTDGEASCPECSGSTDCSSAITEAYQRGVGEGFIQATANGARVMDMEGTITFDQDTPMDRNFAIHIFMESEGTGYAIIDDYIMIDSTSLHDLKEQGATVSAGTYDFFVAVNEEVRYHDDLDVFRIRGPICSISGVTFDAYLYFSKLA